MDAAELARRLREAGANADGDEGDDAICLDVGPGVKLLDFLLSATGTEQATALVLKLADAICEDNEGFCAFCGADIHGFAEGPSPHAKDCLWLLANQWKEEWA